MSLGLTEIGLIFVVVLVLFGGKKIPELARGLGRAQAEYKKAKEAVETEVNEFKAEVRKAAKKESQTKKTQRSVILYQMKRGWKRKLKKEMLEILIYASKEICNNSMNMKA